MPEEITDISKRKKLPKGISWKEVAKATPGTIKGKIEFIQKRKGEKTAAWFREHALLTKKEKSALLKVNKRLFGKELIPEIYFPGNWQTFKIKVGEVLMEGDYLRSGLSPEEIRDSVLVEALRPYIKNTPYLLAQMCVWAVKQGVADDSVYRYLLEYVQRRLRINDRDIAADICNYVVENYTVPLRKGGFHAYLRECAKNYRKNCREIPVEDIRTGARKRKKRSVAEGTKTADEVALEIGCPRRWLYKQIEKGKIAPQVITSCVLTNQDYVEKKRYLFGQECINQVRQLWDWANRRKEIAHLKKEMAVEKGISLRSVQRWCKRMEKESMREGG